MNVSRLLSAAVSCCLIACAAGCGKKGPPLAPLRPVPAAVSGFAIERAGTRVTLRFVIPDRNTDPSTPPAVERVDIFALSKPATAPRPTIAELMLPANLVTSVRVRPVEAAASTAKPAPAAAKPTTAAAPKPSAAPVQAAPQDAHPAPGDMATFVDTITVAPAPADLVRYYAAVAAASRRPAASSPVLRVPLTSAPAAPANVKADYTESSLTVTWQAPAAGQKFVIDQTDAAGLHPERLSPAPLDTASFSQPVAFGVVRCFVVRTVESRESVSIVGEPTPPMCVTPSDHFPPAAPTSLSAIPGAGAVELAWNGSTSSDLAGYLVMRIDEGSEVPRALTPAPVGGTTYRDQTARAGATYSYFIVAVDTATPPNSSGRSNVVAVTARRPAPGARLER